MQAEVRAAKDTSTGVNVAVKIIDRSNMKSRALTALEREINIMKTVSHPNILSLKAAEMDLTFESKPAAILVLELAEGGELFDYLMYAGYFDESLARTYMKQLVSALEACHSNNVFHRDIKPENILLDANFNLKLADFGLSNITMDSETVLETECGTRSYMAPEILEHNGYYGDSADIWSAGVVLFIMLTGSPPFDIANRKDWWFNAVSLNRYDRFWAAHLRGAGHMRDKTVAQDFINRVLVPKVDHRMTLSDMMEHEWLSRDGLDSRKLYDTMLDKMRAVEDAKDAEKAAARRANQGRGGAVNAFDRDTHRSVGGAVPPLYDPATGNRANELFATGDDDILQRLTKEIIGFDGAARIEASPESFSVKAAVQSPGDSFELDGEVVETPGTTFSLNATVSRADESSDLLVVGFQRTGGEAIAFQKFVRQMKSALAPSAPSDNIAEEEEFSEDIGMI